MPLSDTDQMPFGAHQGKQMQYVSASMFLKMLADPYNTENLTSYKSVVRYRSMLQAEFPYLRGKTYRKRKCDAEEIAKEIAQTGTV